MTPLFSWLALCLLAVAWLTTEHIPPWVSWHSEVAIFAGAWLLAIASVGTAMRLQGRSAAVIGIPRPAGLVLVFAAIAPLQVLGGIVAFAGDALIVCFYALLVVTCAALGYNACAAQPAPASGAKRPVLWLAATLLAGACLSTAIALAQVFDLWAGSGLIVIMPGLRRPGANLAQPNQLATLVLMGLASIWMLLGAKVLRGLAGSVLAAFLCVGLAITESRAGFVGFCALFGWWLVAQRRFAPAASPAWAFALGLFYASLFLTWPLFLEWAELMESTGPSRLGQAGLRLSLWQQMGVAALQEPWLGWGVLDVAEAHNAVAHRFVESNALSYSHNLVLDLIVWIGFPGAIAICLVAGLWAVRRMTETRDLVSWYCLAVAIPLVVHSMFEFPFAYAYLLAPVAFLIGVLEGARAAPPLLQVRPRTAIFALVTSGVLLVWSVVEYVDIEEDFRVVRFEQLNLGKTPAGHHKPDVFLLTQLGAILAGSRIELAPGMSPQDMERLRVLALRYPWLSTQYRYAVALALNAQPREAIRQFQVMRAQRGELIFQRVRAQFIELGNTKHPELRELVLQ